MQQTRYQQSRPGRPDHDAGFIDLEERVLAGHPRRTIKHLADEALADLSVTFDAL